MLRNQVHFPYLWKKSSDICVGSLWFLPQTHHTCFWSFIPLFALHLVCFCHFCPFLCGFSMHKVRVQTKQVDKNAHSNRIEGRCWIMFFVKQRERVCIFEWMTVGSIPTFTSHWMRLRRRKSPESQHKPINFVYAEKPVSEVWISSATFRVGE